MGWLIEKHYGKGLRLQFSKTQRNFETSRYQLFATHTFQEVNENRISIPMREKYFSKEK